jgi:hypothetical protein
VQGAPVVSARQIDVPSRRRRRSARCGLQPEDGAHGAGGTSVVRVARIIYPVAVGGLAVAAVLNAITWLPVDVSAFTPVWAALFVGIFPVWFPIVLIVTREQRAYRASCGPQRWYQLRRTLPLRMLFTGAPRPVMGVAAIVAAYVGLNFFVTAALLPGQPEAAGGHYYFNVHGRHIATDLSGYLAGLRYQMRLFTGHQMVFYGVAALVTYGRRRASAQTSLAAGA